MKKWILLASISLSTLSHAVDIQRASEIEGATIKECLSGKHPNLAVHFGPGEVIPIHLEINSDFLAMAQAHPGKQLLKVKQDIYIVSPSKNEVLFSFDGRKWKSFEKLITGNINVEFSQSEEKEPGIKLQADLFARR